MVDVSFSMGLQGVSRLMQMVRRPTPLTSVAEGWLSEAEQRALFDLGLLLDGPMLEIGAWAGKSTSLIAKGIMRSGRQKLFISAEMGPTLENFRPIDEATVGFFADPASATCLATCPASEFHANIAPVLARPGGIIGVLRKNLEAEGVASAVTLHLADFSTVEDKGFKFIFSDCMHTPDEIAATAPGLSRLIGDRQIALAAHDSTPNNQAALRRHFDIGASFQVDSLYVCEIRNFKAGGMAA
jgi:hypothetical protein